MSKTMNTTLVLKFFKLNIIIYFIYLHTFVFLFIFSTREIELDSKSALGRKMRKNPAIRASRHNNNSYNNVNITNNVPKPIISKPIPPHIPLPANLATDISKKPLRDRIIHLLALRPYKKPELISILNRG